MSSFGESELLVISRIVGRIRILDLYHGLALFPRIIIRLGVTLHDNPKNEFSPGRPIQAFELRDVRGEIRLEEHAKVVGALHWAGPPRFVRSSSYGAENQVELACDLDALRVERIEEHRVGREAVFGWLSGRPLWMSTGFLTAAFSLCELRSLATSGLLCSGSSLTLVWPFSKSRVLTCKHPSLTPRLATSGRPALA